MKIIDYKFFSSSANDLGANIRDLIKEGWQPIGGISYDFNSSCAAQAMVKYEEIKPFEPYGHLSGIAYATMPPDSTDMAIDINKGLQFQVKLLQEENEILKDGLRELIRRNVRYSPSHGYELYIDPSYYFDKDHENFHDNILNQFLERRKG